MEQEKISWWKIILILVLGVLAWLYFSNRNKEAAQDPMTVETQGNMEQLDTNTSDPSSVSSEATLETEVDDFDSSMSDVNSADLNI